MTRQVHIPYGEGALSLEIPSDTLISVADLKIANPVRPPEAEVRRALKNSVSLSLKSLVKKDGKIGFVPVFWMFPRAFSSMVERPPAIFSAVG